MTTLKKRQDEFLDKVNQSSGVLYRICQVYTYNQEDWNDLWQDILFQLWRSYHLFQEKSSFSTWMYRVALNTALMHRRKKKRQWYKIPLENVNLSNSENSDVHHNDEVQLLFQCIKELSRIDRAIILLKLEQKSYREIAEITGLSDSNISVRIVRIKEKLRQSLLQKGVKGDI